MCYFDVIVSILSRAFTNLSGELFGHLSAGRKFYVREFYLSQHETYFANRFR